LSGSRRRKQAYIVFFLYLILTLIGFILSQNFDWVFSITGMASMLLVLEIARLRENSKRLFYLIIFLFVFFIFFANTANRIYSIIVLLAVLPVIKIRSTKKYNYIIFINKQLRLEHRQRELIKKYKSARRKAKKLENEINSFSNLYELSKEIEQVLTSEELARISLESLSLRANLSKLAFYRKTPEGYIVQKTKNVTERTALKWLNELDNGELKTFRLKAGKKDLGMIVCRGRIYEKQLKETTVLINQINLGYEKTILYEQVKKLSRTDGLTGLHLRKYFMERFSEEIKRAKREHYKVAFIMADLDNFKNYNDSYGHPMGDKLLEKVADIIKNNIYSSDFAGRYGGEEFCIYMPKAELGGTAKKASKIRALIEETTPITISMGIAYYPDDGITPEDLIKSSDKFLYKAKETGKNRIFP